MSKPRTTFKFWVLAVALAALGGTACEPAPIELGPQPTAYASRRAAQYEADHPPAARPRAEPHEEHPAKRWARAVLGHDDVGYTCQGMDSNDDGYDSCDLIDRRTGRVYPLSCPAAMAIFNGNFNTTCKLRLR